MSQAIINYILDQQDMRKAYIIFRIKSQPDASTIWLDIPEEIRHDKDAIHDFCLETLEETYGELKWLRVDSITKN